MSVQEKIGNVSEELSYLQKLAEGDNNAYTWLVEKYWKKILYHALSFVKSYEVAEELTQDVFLQVWKNRQKLVEVENFDNYLFISSRNLLISHIRKKLVATQSLENEALEEFYLNPERQYEKKELVELIHKAVSLLPEPRHTIFVMSRVEGIATDEISKKTGLAKRTIRWHQVQALNFIRTYLHQYHINLLLAATFFIFF